MFEGIRKRELPNEKGAGGILGNAQAFVRNQKYLPEDALERREPTEREEAILDNKLRELSQLMNESKIRWQLDGAINISVMAGKYIGIHKDIDISIDDKDVEVFDVYLDKKGYGLFEKVIDQGGVERMIRVSAKDLIKRVDRCCEIVAIDENGKIIDDNERLSFVDVHIIDTNENGERQMRDGTIFPEKWFGQTDTEFRGIGLNLSHPARTVFFKLGTERPYDKRDIEKIVSLGRISLDDIEDMRKIFSSSLENQSIMISGILKEIFDKLSGNETSEQVRLIMLAHPEIENYIQARPSNDRIASNIAEKFSSQEERSFEKFKQIAFEFSEVGEQKKEYEDKLEWLRSIIDKEQSKV